ncbi:hypothetical protein L7F22_006174 [Adiantum nelumboides]|nr:hypothetical protein [Adiantum nelumboides]
MLGQLSFFRRRGQRLTQGIFLRGVATQKQVRRNKPTPAPAPPPDPPEKIEWWAVDGELVKAEKFDPKRVLAPLEHEHISNRKRRKELMRQLRRTRLNFKVHVRLAGLLPDILGSADADASIELCRAWGQVRDHQSLVFFDPGARANFITPQLAEKMGIKTDETGLAYTATMAALGLEVAVTPLIGKLQLQYPGLCGP